MRVTMGAGCPARANMRRGVAARLAARRRARLRVAYGTAVGLGFARFVVASRPHQSASHMTQPAILVEDRSTGFLRELGLLDSTMIVAGSMIGSGIFIVSADIARQVGSAGGLILTWVITGLLTITAALSYGELAAMMPAAGGQYVYLREAYSPLWGFLYGWTLFLVIQSGTIAAVAVGFARYLGVLIPWISPTAWIVPPISIIFLPGYAISLSRQQLVGVL